MLDIFLYPWFLLWGQIILWVLLIFLGVLSWKNIVTFFTHNFEKKDVYICLWLGIFALMIRWVFFSYSLYTNDEYMYIQSAKQLTEYYHPIGFSRVIGWPFLLALISYIVWFSPLWGIWVSLIFWSLSVILLYLICKNLFQEKIPAFFAAFLIAILPSHIFWSWKLETNIPALFFILLTFLIYQIFFWKPNLRVWLLAIVITLWTTTFRGENIVLYLPLLLVTFFHRKYFLSQKKNIFFPVIVAVFWVFSVFPNYVSQYLYTNSQSWNYGEGDNIGLSHILWNIPIFIEGFFTSYVWWYFHLITLIGFGVFFFKKKYHTKMFLLFCITFLSISVMYLMIWLKYVYGVDRLYMEVYPLYALFFGVGASYIINILMKYTKNSFISIWLICTLIFANIFQLSTYQPLTKHHILQTQMSGDFSNQYKKECIYIMFSPFYYEGFVDDFRYTYIAEFVNDTTFQQAIFSSFPCVVLADDKFCHDDSPGNKFFWPNGISSKQYCEILKRDFQLSKIKVYEREGEIYGVWNVGEK